MVTLSKSAGTGKIFLRDWHLPDYESRVNKLFKNLVLRAASEAVEIIFDDDENMDISFPFIDDPNFHGDPLTIRVNFITNDSGEDYSRDIALEKQIEWEVECFDPDDPSRFNQVVKRLRELADYMEQATQCPPANPPKSSNTRITR